MIVEDTLNRLALSFFLGGLVSLATITNPLSKIPVFLALAADMEVGKASLEARRACFYGFLLLTWLVLRSARWMSRRLGSEGINVVARLTGFLLVCIGVQFVGSGIRSFIAGV